MSNSKGLTDSLAEVGKVWWLLCSSSPPIQRPQGEMLVEASAASKLRYPQWWPRPLMMPAAWIGLHSICTAQTVRPSAPNSATSMISISDTPSAERPV